MTAAKEIPAGQFRVLIAYPNLPKMMVPGIAIAIFTSIFKELGYVVDLFDTTYYDTNETNFSEIEKNFSEYRIKLLSVRDFSVEKDLGVQERDSSMLADFRRKVEDFKPDFMIYSVVEDTFLQTRTMLRAIEDLGIPHLVGGVFPTMAPEIAITAPEINLIGPGEGEDTVRDVAEAVRKGESLNGIAATWFKDADGTIHRHPPRPLVNINKVRPDFSLYEKSRFMRPMGGRVFKMVPVETYRGCPYACTYCNSPGQRAFAKENKLGNFLRRKPMDKLREDLRYYQDALDPDFFFFVDDSFLARPKQETFDFCDMYEEFKLPFYFNTRAENLEPDILKRLKEVGCYRIALGLEAGNEQYRQNVLKRKVSNEEYIKRFQYLADSGIAFSLNVIIGMPGETRELTFDTIELIRAIQGYDSLSCFIFTPYHGTMLRKVAVENGWLDPDIITKHNVSHSLLRMPKPYLNADEIDGLLMALPLYCYFPKSEWDNIRRAEILDEEGERIRQHYFDIYTRNFFGDTQDSKKIFFEAADSHWGKDPRTYYKGTPDRIDPESLQRLVGTGSPFM